jgi:hypothetical protein
MPSCPQNNAYFFQFSHLFAQSKKTPKKHQKTPKNTKKHQKTPKNPSLRDLTSTQSMSDESGWKIAKGRNNTQAQAKGKKNNNNTNTRPLKRFTTAISSDLFSELDNQQVSFDSLSKSEKDQQAKLLWTKIRKNLLSIINAPDLDSIIQPIYESFDCGYIKQVENNQPLSLFADLSKPTEPVQSSSYPNYLDHFKAKIRTNTLFLTESGDSNSNNLSKNKIIFNDYDFRNFIFFHLSQQQPGKKSIDDPKKTEKIDSFSMNFTHSSLGIGSLVKNQSSLHQFCIYLIIITLFPNDFGDFDNFQNCSETEPAKNNAKPKPLIYDPMFSSLEFYLFELMGLTVLDNTEGTLPASLIYPDNQNDQNNYQNNDQNNQQEKITTKHISFVPHCPVGISHNILQSLWGLENISNLILISNSFEKSLSNINVPSQYYQYCEQIHSKNHRHAPKNTTKQTQLISPYLPIFETFHSYTTSPDFYYSLDRYLSSSSPPLKPEQIISSPELSTPTTSSTTLNPLIAPALSLLLLIPWTRELRLQFNTYSQTLNDMSVHSFTSLLAGADNPSVIGVVTKDGLEEACGKGDPNNQETTQKMTKLFHFCPQLPHYTPPLSDNPELIPASLRKK